MCHYTRAVVDGCVFNLYDDAFIKAEEGKPDFIAKIVELFETVDRLLSGSLGLQTRLYCDMAYSLPHFSFTTLETATENLKTESDASAISDVSSNSALGNLKAAKSSQVSNFEDSTMTLLDLYSGCGAMSTGLCLGASISGLKLVTRWAVDINSNACKSLKLNHSEAEVRNEAAEDFLSLLKEWEKLCKKFQLFGSHLSEDSNSEHNSLDSDEDDDNAHGSTVSPGEFEVGKLLAVCYGDPNKVSRRGLYFKVRWRGYGPSEDTWEPFDGLSKCTDNLKDFVTRGFKSKILPLPGDVCGGPPCQGMSGFNGYRNLVDPLKDPKNHQLVVFMDIFEFLKPKSYLNILYLHEFVGKVVVPVELKEIVVCYENGQSCKLEKSIVLSDAKSDLPPVTNYESRDEMLYSQAPCTNFQKYIRLKRPDMFQSIVVAKNASGKKMLYDHIPLQRMMMITKEFVLFRKRRFSYLFCLITTIKLAIGANFRDLPGVLVGPNNKVEWDPSIERVKVSSGKPLAMLHPEQNRVLTVRENARLQGFPDWYKFWRPVKERYIQVGNAAAFPVSMAFGSILAKGSEGVSNNEPLTTTDLKFPLSLAQLSA
ncbi:hypothetical protein ACSBR1_010043 [Camellia fascicularis]